MTKPIVISQKKARNLILNAQGLNQAFDSSLDIIKQLAYIQIDTISVTERAHNHVFFSRNTNFRKEELNDLMLDRSIFEYWSHAAAYLPIEDYYYSLYQKEQFKTGTKHWFPRDKKIENYVLDKIKSEGPLQSKDFDTPKKSKGWYEWKPTKIALTNLFMDGSLMISNRKGFHKVFDLTERVLPTNIKTSIPTIEKYCNHLINNALKSQGLATLNEICYLRKGVKPTVKKILQELVESKKLQEIKIEGNNEIYYTFVKHRQINANNQVHILSPFDNLIIQRKRVATIFNFDYQIECYVPEQKRKFGYYTLPVLYRDELVARFDAKADRKTKVFIIKGFWFEKKFKPDEHFYHLLNNRLNQFVQFCGCETVQINKVEPTIFKKGLISL